MNIDQIKELVKLLEDSQLNSLEISEGEFRICLEKNNRQELVAMPQMTMGMPMMAASAGGAAPNTAAGQNLTAEAAPSNKGVAVKAPMVGVFYAAPSPEDDPYVSVGDTVKKGQVLCIIEAMKLMNEIIAERDGVVAEVCLESGQVVEYGQPLFYLQ